MQQISLEQLVTYLHLESPFFSVRRISDTVPCHFVALSLPTAQIET